MKRFTLTLAAAAVTTATMIMSGSVSAHFTAVSPYTYWRDVVPILEARCERCHADGSVSGLSLMNYQSARGATWLIRQRLIRGHMPPWFADGPFTSPAPVTARELDILMTWAAGGAPEGRLLPVAAHQTPGWPIGTPDLVVPIPAFTFTTDEGDRVHEVVLSAAKVSGRTIRAVDLLPGTPALVRSAEIIARNGARDQVLGLWQPGEVPSSMALNAGFRIPSAAQFLLRIRYRRLYGAPASDRSQLGIYFADRAAAPIQTIELIADPSHPSSHVMPRSARVLAIRPVAGPSGASVVITLVSRTGSKNELGRIQIQRDWARRYILATPVTVAAGNKIEVSVIPSEAELWSRLTSESVDADTPIRIAIELLN